MVLGAEVGSVLLLGLEFGWKIIELAFSRFYLVMDVNCREEGKQWPEPRRWLPGK